MKILYDSPMMHALRVLDESSVMQAMRILNESPAAQVQRALGDSSVARVLRELDSSAMMQQVHRIVESPLMRAARDLGASPALEAVRRLDHSGVLEVVRRVQETPLLRTIRELERYNLAPAFQVVAEAVQTEYGAEAFLNTCNSLHAEYVSRLESGTPEPWEGIVDESEEQVRSGPSSGVNAYHYIQIVVAVAVFCLDQALTERSLTQSTERILERIGRLEQSVSVQIENLEDLRATGYIIGSSPVALRSGPSRDHDVVMKLSYAIVACVEVRDEWVRVQYFDIGSNELRSGWLRAEDLNRHAGAVFDDTRK